MSASGGPQRAFRQHPTSAPASSYGRDGASGASLWTPDPASAPAAPVVATAPTPFPPMAAMTLALGHSATEKWCSEDGILAY